MKKSRQYFSVAKCLGMVFCMTLVGQSIADSPAAASASDHASLSFTKPYYTANRHPIIHPFGLPNARSAYILTPGIWQSVSNFEIGTIAIGESPGADVIFDGETYEGAFDVSYGLKPGWDIGISFNYLSHSGGGLDNLISDWHDFFGLPNGDRDIQGIHELLYYVEEDGQALLNYTEHQQGFGDVRFHSGYRLSEVEETASALRASIKLPTGDANRLTGSGSVDLTLSYHYSQKNAFGDGGPWTWHASAGLLYAGQGEILETLQRHWVVFGSSTLSWNNEHIALKLQFDYHSPLYNSNNSNVDDHALQVVFGGTVKIDRRNYIDIAVTEDIQVRQSPDIVFILSYRWLSF